MTAERTSGADIERVLAAERLRNSRQVARLRVVLAGAVLVLSVSFSLTAPTFVGAPNGVMCAYTAGAAGIWWARRKATGPSRLDALTIPFVDMPMLFFLLHDGGQRLHAVGAHIDAVGTPLQGTAFFVLMIVFASLSLDLRQIYLATAVAIVLQAVLIYVERPDWLFVIILLTFALAAAAALAAYARSRTISLAEAVAREQHTRERLGRYFSPQVAAHLAEHAPDVRRRREPRSDRALRRPARLHRTRRASQSAQPSWSTLNASIRAWSSRCSPSAARSTSTSATD